MIQHQLSVAARRRPEVLERILRVVRHRGFQVCTINMNAAADDEQIDIRLTVASLRPVELLFNQLSKLVDVTGVELEQLTSQQIRA